MSFKMFNWVDEQITLQERRKMEAEARLRAYEDLKTLIHSPSFESHWIPDGKGGFTCSNCGFNYNAGNNFIMRFCPDCGDIMKENTPPAEQEEQPPVEDTDNVSEVVETGPPIIGEDDECPVIEGDVIE